MTAMGRKSREKQQRQAVPKPPPVGKQQRTWALPRKWLIAGAVLVVALAIGLGVGLSRGGHAGSLPLLPLARLGRLQTAPAPGPLGPEGVPVPNAPRLAGPGSIAVGATIDGIECQSAEQVVYHIHAHLTVFVDGQARQIPYGIGIAQPRQVQQTAQGSFVAGGACFAWLHTHASDGIIHIESPTKRTYTLGEFFDVWGEPLSATRVGAARGRVTTIFNGHVFNGSPRRVPLLAHAQIQLDVGRPLVAPENITFPNGL
jgi:hypothetical protein